ncbi:MAG: esterase-like activity of phytase family protein [Planctomycetota bacterium]|nr:esterase-like activity of phytase family protein [Planctomycetota bacterium]
MPRSSPILIWQALAAFACAASLAACARAQPLSLTFRSLVEFASTTTDQNNQPFTIAGLSGIVHLGGANYLAVMDNSNKLVRLSISTTPNASIASVQVLSGFSLAENRDFEGIALGQIAPNGAASTILLAEEGTPAIHEFSLANAQRLQTFDTPSVFLNRRANFGFESLTRRPAPAHSAPAPLTELWTANEEALSVDGPLSSPTAGTLVRLLRYAPDAAGVLRPGAQYAYLTEPMHAPAITGSRSGISDLLVHPDGRLLALERSFAFDLQTGLFRTRIYEVDFAGATDIRSLASLQGVTYTRVTKRLLWSGNLNNLEGLTLGPRLSKWSWALIGIVDDGDPISTNAVASFELRVGPATAVRR